MFQFETSDFAFCQKPVILYVIRGIEMAERNPAVERLARWIIRMATQLMTDDTRWEIWVGGKGQQFTCKYTVYEDP
jgi:hypothetical protein